MERLGAEEPHLPLHNISLGFNAIMIVKILIAQLSLPSQGIILIQ